MQCGLLGEKLTHSYSPQIHNLLAGYSYDLIEKAPQDLEDFLKHSDFQGLNVTIPYKKAVIPFCDHLSPLADKLGSVNTIVRKDDGSLIGHNTDYYGFASLLEHSGIDVGKKKVLVLGSGGSSVTVTAVLHSMNAQPVVISRTGENNYTNLHLHEDASVIVNTTPVGMYPNTGVSPVDLTLFPKLEGVLDIIYNPSKTKLLLDAESRGIVAENGLWMLIAQAKESSEWFSGKTILDDRIKQIYSQLKKQMENVILVGMPGCGKSTIGALLAKKLEKEFIDADTEIQQAAGMSIPEIFAQHGEAGFREIESKVLRDLGKRSSFVIATGGGCVTRDENYPYLHQNGTIIWLKRNIGDLPTDGRPLSQVNDLNEMYQQRKPLYAAFADLTVENNTDPKTVVDQILAQLQLED